MDVKLLEAFRAVVDHRSMTAAAGAMGALCGGGSESQVHDLEAWGLKFGIAFQHADDILDDDQ